MSRRLAARIGLVVGWMALAAPSVWAGPPLPYPPLTFGPHELERCLRCHGLPGFLYRDSLTARLRDLTVDTRAHVESVHGSLECTQCHTDVKAYPHEFKGGRRPPVGCDADCHATDIQGRPVAHRAEMTDFLAGAHRKGVTGESADSPRCVTCHGTGRPHAIPSPRRTFAPRDRMRLCADCHEDAPRMRRDRVAVDAVSSYRRSFHYKALRLGARTTAVCQDCHGVHRVLAPDSAASTVNARQLVKTCGQKDCHKGARLNFALSGANHLGMRARRTPLLALEERLLVALGAVVMLGVLADMVLDAWRRRRLRRARAAGADDAALVPRLTLAQRLQHGALVGAFAMLALTGLPLRFPDSAALARLYAMLGGFAGARMLHRAAAAVLITAGLAHLVYAVVLLVRARFAARRAWSVLPGRADLGEARELASYLVGQRPLPPAAGRFDTRNKLHYLAVLWGLPVMALSGLVLGFPVALGNRLPDLALGIAFIAHSDEALLAIGVVLVWHVYVVHVSPGAYHRFLTGIDGLVTRAHLRLRHPREAERSLGRAVSPEERRDLLGGAWGPRRRGPP